MNAVETGKRHGSSLRMRGAHDLVAWRVAMVGIIPADAGSTINGLGRGISAGGSSLRMRGARHSTLCSRS